MSDSSDAAFMVVGAFTVVGILGMVAMFYRLLNLMNPDGLGGKDAVLWLFFIVCMFATVWGLLTLGTILGKGA